MSPRSGKSGARRGPSGAASKSSSLASKQPGVPSEAKTKAPQSRSTVRPNTAGTTSDEESVESECESSTTTDDTGSGETVDPARKAARMTGKMHSEGKNKGRSVQRGQAALTASGSVAAEEQASKGWTGRQTQSMSRVETVVVNRSRAISATPSRHRTKSMSSTRKKYEKVGIRSQSSFSTGGSSESSGSGCSVEEQPCSSNAPRRSGAAQRRSASSNSSGSSAYYKAKMLRLSLSSSPISSGGSYASTGSQHMSMDGWTSSTRSNVRTSHGSAETLNSESTSNTLSTCSEGDGRSRYRSSMGVSSSSSESSKLSPKRKRRFRSLSTSSSDDYNPAVKTQRRSRRRSPSSLDTNRRRALRRRRSTVSSTSSSGSDEPRAKRPRPPRRRSSSYEKVLAWLADVEPGV